MKVELKGLLPSNNVLLRMHWAKRKRLIETWYEKVWAELVATGQNYIGNTSYFQEQVVVKLTVYRQRGRPQDEDNLKATAGKLIIDNLVRQHILIDDSPKYVTWAKPIQKTGENRIIIEIEEER